MENKLDWRIWAAWRQVEGFIDVSLIYKDHDPLISGIVREYGDESFRVTLGDRPPEISDSLAMRVLVAIYQHLSLAPREWDGAVDEKVDLAVWLADEVGTRNAATIWAVLPNYIDDLPDSSPLPPPPEEAPPTWRFAARWLEEPGPEWRLARLDLTWHHASGTGGLEMIAKADCRGAIVVEKVVNEDLLLPMGEMAWLIHQMTQRYWKQMLAYGRVETEVADFTYWLGHKRGRGGAWVLGMIEKALRTFGAHLPQQQ